LLVCDPSRVLVLGCERPYVDNDALLERRAVRVPLAGRVLLSAQALAGVLVLRVAREHKAAAAQVGDIHLPVGLRPVPEPAPRGRRGGGRGRRRGRRRRRVCRRRERRCRGRCGRCDRRGGARRLVGGPFRVLLYDERRPHLDGDAPLFLPRCTRYAGRAVSSAHRYSRTATRSDRN